MLEFVVHNLDKGYNVVGTEKEETPKRFLGQTKEDTIR